MASRGDATIMIHIGIVMFTLWMLSWLGWSHPFFFFLSLLYLYKVDKLSSLRFQRRTQFEERKYLNLRRLLLDPESVRWLNLLVQRVWPICMEQIASKHLLMPIIPWFLEKYKPWTAKKAVIQQLYLGRDPPKFTGIRILSNVLGDDDMALELGINFISGENMNAILAVQLRKRLGLGMSAKMHMTGMHVEGKVLVGLKFISKWPFLKRVSICFVEPPFFQVTIKPISQHGLDVSDFPGIAGWIDKILAVAFEQTLVEPNHLIVDVEKFASENAETWFTIDEKLPIAFVKLEIIEATDMQPSDMNGLADPYVKGRLGPYRFKTKIQKKTLAPKWNEEFKIPVSSWESPNVLAISVCDKDYINDDMLGDCRININNLKRGQRQEQWCKLQNIKTGKLRVAITVLEVQKGKISDKGMSNSNEDISEAAESTTAESVKELDTEREISSTPLAANNYKSSYNGRQMKREKKIHLRTTSPHGLHRISAMFSPRQQKEGKGSIRSERDKTK